MTTLSNHSYSPLSSDEEREFTMRAVIFNKGTPSPFTGLVRFERHFLLSIRNFLRGTHLSTCYKKAVCKEL
jgi:hypothetical protein